jgi:hypothetical protein
MANTQTSVPVFTSGQVLTAQQQTEINTGIPVFADSTARDAAFGGTGEKTLAEGQFAFLEDTDATQYYDGSTWQAVGGASGLTFITGASFTTQTSVSLPDDTFTSTYRNYKLFFQLTALTADASFDMRLRTSGTDDTASNYRTAGVGVTSTNVGSNLTGNAQSSFDVGESDAAETWYSLVLDIVSPQVATYSFIHGNVAFLNQAGTSGLIAANVIGHFNATTQFDSLTFISSVASSITGLYKVYGYANS